MNPIGFKIKSDKDVQTMFEQSMRNSDVEHIYVCGSYRNTIRFYKDVSIKKGADKPTRTKASTKIGQVVRDLKANKCARVYVAHNHPNNIVLPSSDDIKFTKSFRRWSNRYNMKLIEHWVVGWRTDGTPKFWNIIESSINKYSK